MLRVDRFEPADDLPALVQADSEHYIPLRYRTYQRPGDVAEGIRHMLLGDEHRRLDIAVGRESLLVRGLTVVLIDQLCAEPLVGPARCDGFGLPVLVMPDGVGFFDRDSTAVSLHQDFTVFAGAQSIEIQIEGRSSFDRSFAHGDVHFLLASNALAGVRFEGLSEVEIGRFVGHATSVGDQ